MAASQSNSESLISEIVGEYTDCMVHYYKLFKDIRSDYRNRIITTSNLIEILYKLFLKIGAKYKHVAASTCLKHLKDHRMDLYTTLADFIKFTDDKFIETENYKFDINEVENFLVELMDQLDLYLAELKMHIALEEKLFATNTRQKKSCDLCLKMPESVMDDLSRRCSPIVNAEGRIFYELSPNLRTSTEVQYEKYFNFVQAKPCTDSPIPYDVPCLSPTEGQSPFSSDTEDEPSVIDQLIPEWQAYLNNSLSNWYLRGAQKPSSECLEFMDIFLGGRSLSGPHTPVFSPVQSVASAIETGQVVYRKSLPDTRSRSGSLKDDDNTQKNILAEVQVDKHIVFKNCGETAIVQYADLNALIVYATENLESEFCHCFCTTYRSFIAPFDLVDKLAYRFEIFYGDQNHQAKNTSILCARIAEGLTRHSITEEYLKRFVIFMHKVVEHGEIEWAAELRTIFERQLREYHKMQTLKNALPEYTECSYGETTKTILDFKAEAIAQEITLMAYELFSKIEIAEFLELDEKPNLTAFARHCEKLSYWVTTIIGKLNSRREVEKHIKHLVNIMKHLREYRNYSSCWAILAGIQTSAIYKVTKKYDHLYREFNELYSPIPNFRNYRQLLKESKLPRIPSICIALQDLIHLSDATEHFKPAELETAINFYRIWRQYKYIKVFKEDKIGYPFKKNYKILTFFRNFDNHILDSRNSN